MIELQNFSKRFKDKIAVNDFSMICREGEITGILGLNGAGKTTILKAICGRHFATSGKVLVNGIDASEETERIRNLTGFVMEQSNLPEELKVSEFLKMTYSLHCTSSSKNECEEALSNVKKTFSLDSVWNEKIKNLSKGFKERVNFSQALVYNPPVLVLDEPASGLDPAQIMNMRKTVKFLKQNHTIILSTHLMQEVDALCDRIYILNKGKCAASGTAQEIIKNNNKNNLEEVFFELTKEN